MAKVTQYVENALLIIIGLLTLVGAIEAIYHISQRREVALQDLLPMFLYVEVLGMVGAYYNSKQIPISFPDFYRDYGTCAHCHSAERARPDKSTL